MVDTDDRRRDEGKSKAFMERLTERALEMGGTCTGEHGVGQGKMKYLLAEHGAPAIAAMRAIKQALDPGQHHESGQDAAGGLIRSAEGSTRARIIDLPPRAVSGSAITSTGPATRLQCGIAGSSCAAIQGTVQATLLTLAIAAILALLAALLGPYFVDWNAHRATFEQQASQAIGLPVRVTGPMQVRLLPSPTLVLSGIEIGAPGDAQALRAKALGIEFALPPLLSGKFRAVEMRLIAPEMRVSLTQDGRALLPNALSGVNTEPLSIDKLVVEDASLQFNDAASGDLRDADKALVQRRCPRIAGPDPRRGRLRHGRRRFTAIASRPGGRSRTARASS